MKHEIVRVDPTLPICWEDLQTLRIGFDQAEARVTNPTPAMQRLLNALLTGIRTDKLSAAAREAGATRFEQRRLLDELGPVLVRSRSWANTNNRIAPVVLVPDRQPFADYLAEAVSNGGFAVSRTTRVSEKRPQIAVIVERYIEPAERAQQLLIAGVPHLPLRLTDRSVTLGPIILAPGAPCLGCIELHGLDQNPLGPVLAAQMLDLQPASETIACAEAMGALLVTLLRHWSLGTAQLLEHRLHFGVRSGVPDLFPTIQPVTSHPCCGCVQLQETMAA